MIAPRSKLTWRAVRWALRAGVVDRASVARAAADFDCSWRTSVNDAVLASVRVLRIDEPNRLDGVKVLGVNEHCWRPRVSQGTVQRFVVVVTDLILVRDRTGRPGCPTSSKAVSKAGVHRPECRPRARAFWAGIETVAMDGFTGFKTAAAEASPKATAVMDPLHVALAGDAVDRCRQRVQQQRQRPPRPAPMTPSHGIRRVLRTGASLLTRSPARRPARGVRRRAANLAAGDLGIYRRIVAAYRHPDHAGGRSAPHCGGRFRNLANYITGALLDTGGFRPRLHLLPRWAGFVDRPDMYQRSLI